jgi:hypothetical protein
MHPAPEKNRFEDEDMVSVVMIGGLLRLNWCWWWQAERREGTNSEIPQSRCQLSATLITTYLCVKEYPTSTHYIYSIGHCKMRCSACL